MNDLDRIRISSIEPNLLSNDIIEFCAKSKKIMPHFHIPLQSGSSRILKLMRRKYQTSLYKERIEHIKSLIPDACIGADIIVGFPSETDDDFQKSYDFIESLNISYLHVFSYSERQNTKAIKIKNVKTNKTSELKVDGLFIAIGHDPATSLFKGQLNMDKEGYIVTNPDSTITNVPGVFAAGDVKDKIFRQAVTAAGMGCMAALEAEKHLSSK